MSKARKLKRNDRVVAVANTLGGIYRVQHVCRCKPDCRVVYVGPGAGLFLRQQLRYLPRPKTKTRKGGERT